MSGLAAAQRRIWVSRLAFCGIRRRQKQHQSRDATQCRNAIAPIFLISLTFSPLAPKIFHDQTILCPESVILVKYRSPQAELPRAVFGQGHGHELASQSRRSEERRVGKECRSR